MKKTENATHAKTSTGSHGRLRVIAAPAVGVQLPMAERGSRVRSAVLGGGKRRGMLVMWWKNSKDHGRGAHGSYAFAAVSRTAAHKDEAQGGPGFSFTLGAGAIGAG
jgi:hypothetical protein